MFFSKSIYFRCLFCYLNGYALMTSTKNILYWLVANSVGGYSRGLIINQLFAQPENAYNLSIKLNIDYNTTRYHLNILLKNGLLETAGDAYGKTYFITNNLMDHKKYFYKIWNEYMKK